MSIQKGDVQLEQTDEEKSKERRLKKEFEPLLKWWKKLLGDKVTKVEVSKRLVDAPCAVVASEWGYSAQMEKIMKTQTFADPRHVRMMTGQKVLEINPNHRIIQHFLRVVKSEAEDKISQRDKELAKLLYEVGKLASGFEVDDPKNVAASLIHAVAVEMSLPADSLVEEYPVPPEEPEGKAADEPEEESKDGVEAQAEDELGGQDANEKKADEAAEQKHDEL